ncbi:hypothetical protein Cst_c00020 [Thermoclostridium stercorarium subsp. stercorarium DSM 8532]|uniref:Uncharacterized protein n=1 Tax=Thermoclostridium stercorarium (strain ATCC 35414 / DSM 8532 / NCIMB 11754) TaxID=1121335 RepID=L7VJZ0_THES1|nr:hypothetical protein Cst_c00020 [Thermoclostridium stercorarium subsp. stercorarium DSM 8532]
MFNRKFCFCELKNRLSTEISTGNNREISGEKRFFNKFHSPYYS